MRFTFRHLAHLFIAALFTAALSAPQSVVAHAAQHLVSPSELQQSTVDASQTRQQNVDTINTLLATDQAQQALNSAHVTPQQVKKAVAGMSDDELSDLASRAQKAQAHDLAAGGNTLLLLILLIVAIVIIVAVIH